MEQFDARATADGIVRWIRDRFDGTDCLAVVGLSGGKDSSVVAALCAEALGAGRVLGVLLPRGRQWDMDVALDLAGFLGIRHLVADIGGCTDALLAAVRGAGLEPNGQAETNAPARIRMAALYAVAATVGGRVANTCNLSEDWVGYSTKFGDAAGDFSPLSLLTASEVRAVGGALGLPERFTDKTPEDGLSGLTDEENLGFSYDVLDRYIREGICADTAVREKIDRLYAAGRHKIEPMPCYRP